METVERRKDIPFLACSKDMRFLNQNLKVNGLK